MSAPDLTCAVWKKSSRSGNGDDANCVEVAVLHDVVGVRDSTKPLPVLVFSAEAWRGFVAAVRGGEFVG